MRKLKLQVQMTLDGFISGTNGEMDWMTFPWTADISEYVKEITEPVDTILLGRKLAEGFIPHWTAAFNKPEPEDGSKKIVETPKVVFTKTLNKSIWSNTVLATGDIVDEVNRLKNQNDGDIIAYGGGQFVSSLIQNNLIDEYHFFVNPAAIGNGMPIFKSLENNLHLKLIKAKSFECGIVVLCYETKK